MDLPRIAKILQKRNDLIINEVVLDTAQKRGQIVYGARAYNLQSPTYLKKKTMDYDILTTKPKQAAKDVAKKLSARLGRKVDVIRGKHKGTYRIKLDNEIIADYTQISKKPKTKKVWGTEVKNLKSIKRNAQRLVKNPKTEFRRDKDLDTLSRIAEIERMDAAFGTN